jgi:hypothetical protein
LGDSNYIQDILKDAVFKTAGVITGYDHTKLLSIFAKFALEEYVKQKLIPGQSLTQEQIVQLKNPIIWPVWSKGGHECLKLVEQCMTFKIYYDPASVNKFYSGVKMITSSACKLPLQDLLIGTHGGLISTDGSTTLTASGVVANLGEVKAASIDIEAQNILNLGSAISTSTTEGGIKLSATDNVISAGITATKSGNVLLTGKNIIDPFFIDGTNPAILNLKFVFRTTRKNHL